MRADNLQNDIVRLTAELTAKTEQALQGVWELSELLDAYIYKVRGYTSNHLTSKFTLDEIDKLNNLYIDTLKQKANILAVFHTDSLMDDISANHTKTKSTENTGSNDYYNKTWSIWNKLYFILLQSGEAKSVPQLLEKILEFENISIDSEEAKRINVNINATLSAKFRIGNDLIMRKKVHGEYKYFVKVEENTPASQEESDTK